MMFRSTATNVVGPEGKRYSVPPGAPWPVPYRGLKLSVRTVQGSARLCHSRRGWLLHASWPTGLQEALRSVKNPPLGSLRITAHGQVVTKCFDRRQGVWIPRYLGCIDGVPEIEGFDHDPSELRRGCLWTGLSFRGGETWSVFNRRRSGDRLYWTRQDHTFASTREFPGLCAAYREIRPRGGRLTFVPGGHVWMNLSDRDISARWRATLKHRQGGDLARLRSSPRWSPLLRMLAERLEVTKTLPIYLGHIDDLDPGSAPWTRFSLSELFGGGSNSEDDDDDEHFSGRGWRRMR